MNEGLIACPNCGHEFELSDAITGRVREHLKAELQQDIVRREVEVKKRQDAVAEQERVLAKQREEQDELVAAQLKERLAEAEQKVAKRMEGQYVDQLKELKETLEERESALKELRQKEVDLRKKQRELEEAKEAAELDIARKLDEERAKIREQATKKFAEEHRLKDLEKDKVINDLRASLEDMKRKAEQGSMETQGEVLEQDFEAQLRSFFPLDDIQPVPKGVRGADLVHSVCTPDGKVCGVLLWETKNTKAWSSQWIPKLKEDMVDVRADIAILASAVIPQDVERFGQVDGVWVADPVSAIPLAAALRQQLIAVNRERTAAIGKGEKTEMLYQYLAGNEFKQKIEGIVEAFTAMQDQINQERRAMEKHWKQRQKQIERVVKNTVGLYGDMQGIIGGDIPVIPSLELNGGDVRRLTAGSESVVSEEENGDNGSY